MATTGAVDFVEYLPKELSETIFKYLSARELSVVSQCSTSWRTRTNQDHLWLHHCMVRGWLRFGLRMELLNDHLKTDHPRTLNVSGTSPKFDLQVPEDSKLDPVCKWKNIFVRCQHLKRNWETGCYTVQPILRGHKEKVTALDSNGYVIVSGSADKTLRVWDVIMSKIIYTIDVHSDTITAVRLKKNLLVTACADGLIRVFDANSGFVKLVLKGHEGSVDKMLYDGADTIVSAGSDKSVRVWSISKAKMLHILRGHTDEIECMYTHGHLAVTGSWDNNLIVWDTQKGRQICQLQGHTEVVSCCQFDERHLVSGSADCTLRIWSMAFKSCYHVLKGHTEEVYCLVYNKDIIASGSSDSTVRIWNFKGQLQHVLREHLGVVRCLHLNSDRLVSGGDQKKVVVWDYRSGQKLIALHRQPTLLHLMHVTETKLITATPERPGTITVLSFW